jgi:hypothetical protein
MYILKLLAMPRMVIRKEFMASISGLIQITRSIGLFFSRGVVLVPFEFLVDDQ